MIDRRDATDTWIRPHVTVGTLAEGSVLGDLPAVDHFAGTVPQLHNITEMATCQARW